MTNRGAIIVSIIATAGFVAILTLLTVRPITLADNQFQLLNTLIGMLAMGYGTVLNYWLGSSNGSANKDRLLMRQADAAQTPDSATPAKP